jgi:hypothetical protein
VDRYLLKPVPLRKLLETAAELLEAETEEDDSGPSGS